MENVICDHCGSEKSLIRITDATFQVSTKDLVEDVEGLSGHRCEVCGEVYLDAGSTIKYADAGDALIMKDRELQQELFEADRQFQMELGEYERDRNS